MKKGLIYYCLIASLLFHLLAVFLIRFEQAEKHKEKEPIAVDLVGPLKQSPVTKLPEHPKLAAIPPSAQRQGVPTPAPAPKPRAVIPALPMPEPLPLPKAPSQQGPSARPGPVLPPPSPEQVPSPVQPGGGGGATAQKASPPAPSAPQGAPKRLKLPTAADLERYASTGLEKGEEKDKKSDAEITLDTDDLKFTSYLQGLKNRIEMAWKYPETARRDGLQGQLVMRFSIMKSGKLDEVELIKSSGYPLLDNAAKQALVDANPFNPLPDNWKKDRFTITGTFVYRLYGE
jgi:protein TonB